ncbi:3-hydroxyisobutyrate dehydrogenase [Meinhardsimonia xiamenensis]|uniref:3-hydroxyisobutyrate dehydrogenase n=1 Tax=Meinhardsimonia xiamenensis TaxID=990712 RepID=A0A1G9CM97_9RHOB|nr:NAD(P)-binding domain-containing protein [Meinhardsimonia xiamenensis]PRX38316.1 3-hydroxyisobutyrate dehydrogenase [Meinhardsimonia xiamenensis]SDK52595.1 3-hydroxyisobutyrate dehydrogenase [Meinhardsimonia xiamenensis]
MGDALSGIGIAGCGRMGAPMLRALRTAGFDARGFDIRPPADYGPLAPAMTDDPAAFARGLRILVTVVRDIAQTEALLFDAQRMIERADELEALVISSTLSPRWLARLPARLPARIALVDAPMSGAAVRAERRELSFMLGGDKAVIDRLMPLFEAMGSSFHRMGAFGAGMQAKVLNNLLAASHTAMTRLVLEWADAAGIDEAAILRLIHASSGQNWFASGFDEIEFARDGMGHDNTIGILVKDVESALDAAPEGAATDLPRAVQAALAALRPRR